MNEFMIFVAPFLTVILSIIVAFLLAPMDNVIKGKKD